MGYTFWLSIPSCQWSYNHLWSRNMWWIQHQQTTKCIRVEWNVTHIMRVRELYWQFCWYLVHSKPTTHRHYRLLRTRTSHRQLKLVWLKYRERTCYLLCPVLVEVDRELHSRSKAYLLTHLLLTSLVPIAWMQTWVSQPNHAQPRQVALKMKNKWEPLLPPLTWVVRKPSRYEVDSPLLKAIRASYIIVSACDTVTFPGDCMLLFIAMPMGLGPGRDDKGKKVHICAKHSQASTNQGTRIVTEHTNEYKYIRHAWFEFRQPSDLIRGFGEGPILSYGTIQEAE